MPVPVEPRAPPPASQPVTDRSRPSGAPLARTLLTDVALPQMSGCDLVEWLGPGYPEMKTLYMSGHTTDVIEHHGVLVPDAALLLKPFTPDALTRKVREVLDRNPEG